MSEITLAVFDLAGTTTTAADHVGAALTATLSALGLPIPAVEINTLSGSNKRDAIEQLLLRFSPEQATSETVDQLFAEFNQRLGQMQREPGIRAVEGAEEVFRWLGGRGVKVALTTALDREAATHLLTTLNWASGIADAIVCSDNVRAGRPAPYLIFRAMELTGTTNVKQVAVLGDTVLDLEAGANAGVAMNVGLLSGATPREKLEQAPHTHLIESIRKMPPLFAGLATSAPAPAIEAAPQAAKAPPPAPAPPAPPSPKKTEPPAAPGDPLGPGFTTGSGL